MQEFGGLPEFIPASARPLSIGRSENVAVRLEVPTVSRLHASLERNSSGLRIQDHNSQFGTFVNGSRIHTRAVNLGDSVRFGSCVAYRVESNGLRLDKQPDGIALRAAGIDL